MRGLYRIGGVSAIVLGMSYIIITVLYFMSGTTLPESGEEWLKHIAGHTTEWWAILGFSVLTDLLFIPLARSLIIALKGVNKNAILAGTGFLILFVILDLAVTWPNYSVLISLSSKYAVAINDTQRMAFIAAADYASGVLSSGLFGVYAILVPSLGIFIISLVMLRSVFSKVTAYIGLVSGILGFISVAGPFFIPALGIMAIIASVLTTVWVLLVGYKLLRLSQSMMPFTGQG
jgi:hypothetical protein